MKTLFGCVLFLLGSISASSAQDFLDRLDDSLTISAFQDRAGVRISGLLDLEYYHFPQPPPDLIRSSGHDLFEPRLTLFLDGRIGPKIYFFAQARLDTGFDPANHGAQIRLDEYALRITPWDDARVNLQVGKFATVVGRWVERHLSWDNPFVDAPLPYETPTLVSDVRVPWSSQGFTYIRAEDRYEFLPIIWGPAYAEGAAVTGEIGHFEYAAELKNAPPSSRPETWNDGNFARPAIDLRLGMRPNAAWRFGLSAAEGPYFQTVAYQLPDDIALSDYREILLGQDISYARGHWQIWAETFETRFQEPRVGNANIFAYYIETKYQIAPQLFGALRWNQEMFDSGRDAAGNAVAKAHDIWRADVAIGYRFSAHTQLKLQYSLANGDFLSEELHSIFAAEFTVRF